MVADAGVLYPVLANTTAGRGLAGLEFATGIPGTVGGAVYMNAGAYGSETREVLDWADVFRDGEVVRMRNEDLDLSYRHSALHENPDWLVLRAGYTLVPGDPDELKASIKESSAQRMNRLPEQAELRLHLQAPPRGLPRPRHRGGRSEGNQGRADRSLPRPRQLPRQPRRRHGGRGAGAHRPRPRDGPREARRRARA